MQRLLSKKSALVAACTLALAAIAAPQLGQILKIGGVGLLVSKFGKDIDKGFNDLAKVKKTDKQWTKVVPILRWNIGGGRNNGIGAAQVMGVRSQVEKVQNVAALETKLLGEITIRALIPVSSKDVIKDIRRVDGVGVSGIIDIRL